MVKVWIRLEKITETKAVNLKKGHGFLVFMRGAIMNLQESRKKIDAIDEQIVTLLNRRAAEVRQVGRIKAAAGLPMIDDAREAEIYRRVAAENYGQIETEALIRIFEQIVVESRRMQVQATTDVVEIGEIVQ